MSTSRSPESGPVAGDACAADSSRDGSPQGPLDPDQILRWAALIADGGGEFPAELSAPDRDRLAEAVRRRLRERLVSLVARAIAHDLYRRGRSQEDSVAADRATCPPAEGHGGPTL